MKKILITGGAGFVGRRFVKRHLDLGNEVHCVDPIAADTGGIDPEGGWPLYAPNDYESFHFYKQDCRTWFREHRDDDFDYVFHLAAMVGGRAMIENNPLAVADDLSIDAEYWQWAKAAKPAKTVCFSSSAAYPIGRQRELGYELLSEDMIQFDDDIGMPDMSYGWAKLTCEYLALLAYEKHGLKSVCYRPFSGYGEDQDESYPFPSICKRAMAHVGEPTLSVWGTGDQMRDFIYIEDCVDGVLTTMDKIDNGDALNLSTGIYTSFKQFARIAAEECGYEPEVVGLSDKPAGVFARGGCTKKQAEYGFKASVSFREGIKKALALFAARAS
ncbi:dTDP-glucose 4,6-dehydratase [Rosistilla carotiformis]|uniref:dTDP-glucose 4,6-dehydratase n=1 Tax=Rosistilla carotiformis TaxID=2528017 RepID=A0A518JVH1_9BACT|nr:NAD(P)-dependent oxidoreductase [Rosistilla carotiformis]QDV69535.1 dTDP-glucose 4,6-dehydratase [Rosistilla carotiformis]